MNKRNGGMELVGRTDRIARGETQRDKFTRREENHDGDRVLSASKVRRKSRNEEEVNRLRTRRKRKDILAFPPAVISQYLPGRGRVNRRLAQVNECQALGRCVRALSACNQKATIVAILFATPSDLSDGLR